MRMSALFLRTLRDDPADAEIDSHRLLLRAGCIRRVASGIYSWLPLGRRVLAAVEHIVRDEMDATGRPGGPPPHRAAPRAVGAARAATPPTGPLMFRLEDRKETGLLPVAHGGGGHHVTGGGGVLELPRPAREPVPDQLEVPRRAAPSVRPAPGARVPDEGRVLVPRRRARISASRTRRCTTRTSACSPVARSRSAPVEAQAGEIGGDVNHEFMAVASIGEDDFVWCTSCDYAANVEAARRHSRLHQEVPAIDARNADATAPDGRGCTRPSCRGSPASRPTSGSSRRRC